MSKILNSPEYLKVWHSEKKAPFTDYPQKLAEYIFSKYHLDRGSLLDLGCGRGEHMKAFGKLGYETYGTDICVSEFAIQERVLQVDLNKDPYIDYWAVNFDHVFCKSVIERTKEPSNLLTYAYNSLKTGGDIIIITPSWVHHHKKTFYIDSTNVTPFTRLSLKLLLEMNGFKDVHVEYFYQLPLLWKHPKLKIAAKALSLLPLPWAPVDDVPWTPNNKLNKIIRFSNEVMLLAHARK